MIGNSLKKPNWLWFAIGGVATIVMFIIPGLGDVITKGVTALRDKMPWLKKK